MAEDEPDETPSEEAPEGPGADAPGVVTELAIEEEMRSSYIDYAMSVIVGRALPDTKDGLKPVHRRILYSMHDMGIGSGSPARKAARVVGDVLGKYHPHGDSAIYDSLVRMAQDFSLRYPLIEGQGNFGSIDGDNAAAMRYTECRLTPLAEEMLEDIDLGTVDWTSNFDASTEEPLALPGKVPNLLLNGSAGIAVGMATNMAPHNLGETVDAIKLQLENPDVDVLELMEVLPGPDFPTGGIIQGKAGIKQAYATGRGIVRLRGRIDVESEEGRLVVTEIPYMVNKSKLLQDIAGLVRDKKLEGIRDLRDESNQEGIRVLIELKRGAEPEIVKNQLFQMTQLQNSFGINNVALVDNEPKVLTLKDMIHRYIEHRLDVIVRRTQHLLEKAEARAHIVEGLLIAQRNIDAIIELIRASEDRGDARANLIAEYELSEDQANAILDMRLSQLTRLEQGKLEEELAQLKADIEEYNAILADRERQKQIIRDELEEIREDYDDDRRTEIRQGQGDLVLEDLIPDDPVVIQMTQSGYIKRVPLEAYRTQGRGGRGVIGMQTKEEDHVVDVFTCTNHQRILLVTQDGIVHDLKAYQVPEGDRYARGVPVVSLLERLEPGTEIQAALPVEAFTEDRYLFFATREGKVKKTPLTEYEQINVNGKIAVRLNEGDELIGVGITDGDNEIILVKDSGKGVRFHEEQVRPMGRVAAGVKGTELRDEEVVSMVIIQDPEAYLLTVTTQGKGKRTPFGSFNPKNRGVWGVYMHGVSEKTGPVVGAIEVDDEDEVLFTSKNGVVIRSKAGEISEITSGGAQGVFVQRLEEDDQTVAVARLARDEEMEDAEEAAEGSDEGEEAPKEAPPEEDEA